MLDVLLGVGDPVEFHDIQQQIGEVDTAHARDDVVIIDNRRDESLLLGKIFA